MKLPVSRASRIVPIGSCQICSQHQQRTESRVIMLTQIRKVDEKMTPRSGPLDRRAHREKNTDAFQWYRSTAAAPSTPKPLPFIPRQDIRRHPLGLFASPLRRTEEENRDHLTLMPLRRPISGGVSAEAFGLQANSTQEQHSHEDCGSSFLCQVSKKSRLSTRSER